MKNITDIFNGHLKISTTNQMPNGFPLRGIYYWWAEKEVLELLRIPFLDNLFYVVHNSKKYFLCYIGIGPMGDRSSQSLYKRIYSSHLGNRIYGSTLRYSIAALMEYQFYRKDKPSGGIAYSLTVQDENRITNLLQNNWALSITEHNRPWSIEVEQIQQYNPPLNIDHNSQGWFCERIEKARGNSRNNAMLL